MQKNYIVFHFYEHQEVDKGIKTVKSWPILHQSIQKSTKWSLLVWWDGRQIKIQFSVVKVIWLISLSLRILSGFYFTIQAKHWAVVKRAHFIKTSGFHELLKCMPYLDLHLRKNFKILLGGLCWLKLHS